MINAALSRLIQRSPEIPRRDGAIRAPLLAVLHQLSRRGKFPFAKSFGEPFLHSVIAHWPNIRTAKVKQQKHLHSPPTYAAYLRETRDDFVIAHSEKRASGWHGAVDRLRREIFYCRSLCARKTSAAKLLFWCGKNF